METTKMNFNTMVKEIATKRKAKEDTTDLQAESKAMKDSIKVQEDAVTAAASARDAILMEIGNLVHDSVPISNDEANNAVVATWGSPREAGPGEKLFNHYDLVQLLDIVELDKGAEVAGNRGYYLKGAGTLLNQALINCAMQFLYQRGY